MNNKNVEMDSKSDIYYDKIEDINTYFKIPLYYNSSKVTLTKNIATDLELVDTIDASANPIYSFCFNNPNKQELSRKLVYQFSTHYTTDVSFLKETQKLITDYKKLDNKYVDYSPNYTNILKIWHELKNDSGFKEKYYYVDWNSFEFLNSSEHFLLLTSLFNILSPVIALLSIIFIFIIPFFILKLKGINLSVTEYVEVLKTVAKNNAIGQILTADFANINANQVVYLIASAIFYVFSVYQNVMTCIKFNTNMKTIHSHLKETHIYLQNTLASMENYLLFSQNYNTQTDFNIVLREKCEILKELNIKISCLTEYRFYDVKKYLEIGKVLKYFYELHENKIYNDAILYSLGFNGYIDCIEGLQSNIVNGQINFATFTDNNKKTNMQNSYYACLKDAKPVKNNIKLRKNITITGPNASGKTTVLKATIINLILTQQFGCGFYDSAQIYPFDYIHCYLNIPDTSGRDSLFQAEARRCKNIIDDVNCNKNKRHFCVFDELFSGTNPDEAVTSATSFMQYLIKNKNVLCILTTHFIKVCKKLAKNKNVSNCKMVINKQNDKIIYTYKIIEGISDIKGGVHILSEMDFPKEIINNANTAK
jgi:hypothetical protein